MAKKTGDAYLDTVARMEPEIAMVDTGGAAASIAISLKRIADSLEKLADCVDAHDAGIIRSLLMEKLRR